MARPTIRVLAFDPAATLMGWALVEYTLATGSATVLKHGTLNGAHLVKTRKPLLERFSKQYVILDAYFDTVCEMILEHRPDEVVVEGAFHHRFVAAFLSLALVIHTIRRACAFVTGRDIQVVAPMETKKEVAGDHMADKVKMRAKVSDHPRIALATKAAPFAEASEHAIDAIAHGAAFCFLKLPAILADNPLRYDSPVLVLAKNEPALACG